MRGIATSPTSSVRRVHSISTSLEMLELNRSNFLYPLPLQLHMPKESTNANRSDQLLRPLLPRHSLMPPADDPHANADEVVEHADNWQLSKNTIYRNLQKALAQRTHERDVYR